MTTAASAFYHVIENFQADETLCAFLTALVSALQRDLLGKVEIQRQHSLDNDPKDQVSQQLTGSAFSCFLTLLSFREREREREQLSSYIFFLRLHPQFPLVPISFQLFHTFLVPWSCLYKIVIVFQIHANLLMSVSSLFPIHPFSFLPRYFSALLTLSLFVLLVFMLIRLVLLTWLFTHDQFHPVSVYALLIGFHD